MAKPPGPRTAPPLEKSSGWVVDQDVAALYNPNLPPSRVEEIWERWAKMRHEGQSGAYDLELLAEHPNAAGRIRANTHLYRRRVQRPWERDGRGMTDMLCPELDWDEEQWRLAGDLVGGWRGSVEEFIGVIEAAG